MMNSNQYDIKGKLLSFESYTPASICFYIKEISSNKSTGPDGICVQMLKKTLPYIVDILTDMFNRILSESCFPSGWKLAGIKPIFKQGDKSNPSSFRPISIPPVLSQVFEKHISVCLTNLFIVLTKYTRNESKFHKPCEYNS